MTDAHGKWGVSEWTSEREAKQAWRDSGITDALKSLLFSTWGQQTLSRRWYKTIPMGDPDPKWYLKADAHFPAFPKEPRSSKGLVRQRETGDYRLLSTGAGCFTYITVLNPNSIISSIVQTWTRSLPEVRRLSAVVPTLEPTSWVYPSPHSQLHQAVSHGDTEHVPERKARVLGLNRKWWTTTRYTRVSHGHFPQN